MIVSASRPRGRSADPNRKPVYAHCHGHRDDFGAVLVMWMGELIEKGIGNGMSLLIFAGIATVFQPMVCRFCRITVALSLRWSLWASSSLLLVATSSSRGQRRIPVQYAKRMVGRRQYGGSSTYLPLKVNQAGVIPVIFASSLIYMPVLITQIVNSSQATPPDITGGSATSSHGCRHHHPGSTF